MRLLILTTSWLLLLLMRLLVLIIRWLLPMAIWMILVSLPALVI
jgi:hypothetical protein